MHNRETAGTRKNSQSQRRKKKREEPRTNCCGVACCSTRGDTPYLYKSIATVMIPAFTVGTLLGWEFVYIMGNDANIMAVPFLYLGAIIGVLVSSCIMDRQGRYISLFAFFWFLYIAILMISFFTHPVILCLARVLGGFSVGAYYQVVPIYIAEICYRRYRGIIFATLGYIISLGITASPNPYVFAVFLVVDLFLGMVYLFLKFYYAPESPYFDVAKDNILNAKQTLENCRNGDQWTKEIREISLDVSAYPRDVTNCFSFTMAFYEMNADFLHRAATGAGLVLLSQGMFISCHLGFNRDYTTTGERLGILMVQILLLLLSYMANLFVIDKYGRKVLLFASAIGVTIFYLILFIIHFFDLEDDSAAIIIVRKAMVLFFYLGWDFIPILIISEILPYTFRAPAMAFFLCLHFITKSILPILTFYTLIYMSPALQTLMLFFVALAGVFFSWYIPAETKQLSLCAVQIKMDHDVTILEKYLDVD